MSVQSTPEAAVAQACDEFVARLNALSDHPEMRQSILELALREVVWALIQAFGHRFALAVQLEHMAEEVRSHDEKDH
jgi:hypothetical protein